MKAIIADVVPQVERWANRLGPHASKLSIIQNLSCFQVEDHDRLTSVLQERRMHTKRKTPSEKQAAMSRMKQELIIWENQQLEGKNSLL